MIFWHKLIILGYEDVEDWLLSDPKGNRAGELYVVKNFRDKKTDLALPHRQKELCRLNHVCRLHPRRFALTLITFASRTSKNS